MFFGELCSFAAVQLGPPRGPSGRQTGQYEWNAADYRLISTTNEFADTKSVLLARSAAAPRAIRSAAGSTTVPELPVLRLHARRSDRHLLVP